MASTVKLIQTGIAACENFKDTYSGVACLSQDFPG